MKTKLLVLFNTLTLIFTIFINYLSNTGFFGGKTIGEISKKYETLFVPAGYAFSIWGLIFLMLLAFVGFQWYVLYKFRNENDVLSNYDNSENIFIKTIHETSFWLIVANICNATWVFVWLNEYVALSVMVMFFLLLSLIQLTRNLRLEIWDAPVRIIAFVWWPIVIYLGWIMVASIANISSFLVSIGWQGGLLSASTWTILMIIVATVVYLTLIVTRNLRETAMVGVWSLIAISYKQWQTEPTIAYVALGCAILLFLAAMLHGYKNQETSPFLKWKRGEI
ncbi:hypothetical protein Fleli_2186 [Bernardetia litoralis DSM 6794]|uniref:Tryptophan-rich sensory protein n=1 Tax=Bernardetia litoralis (strain ATCC 23117 / DSM 6794 / NBRC 15988 / NCIMB 1366 / Fx l1 / Sio-4) TaxID=880071 RepID=I4AKT0_BERLS|nr:hypothetical protein [Bernardetia litoralis]AFM04565.1 hypothetical protein Fleli_2186 [Bernardetia litoralis DSM 6794]